jgi:hypothetical protein
MCRRQDKLVWNFKLLTKTKQKFLHLTFFIDIFYQELATFQDSSLRIHMATLGREPIPSILSPAGWQFRVAMENSPGFLSEGKSALWGFSVPVLPLVSRN